MIITYYGLEFFKIQHGDLTIAYNPISKKSKVDIRPAHFGADIALVALNHPDFNGVENLSHGEKAPFVISGPGEYERRGVRVEGFLTKTNYGGKEPRLNTLYYLFVDGIKTCFTGPLDSLSAISDETQEEISGADILLVPIGGGETLSPEDAYKLSLAVEPKIIIPMHFSEESSVLKKFLKEAGEEKTTPLERLTVKKKDIEDKEGEIVVLKPLG